MVAVALEISIRARFWLSAELHVHNHQNPLFVDGSNVLSTHLHHIHLHVVASGIEPSVWIRLIGGVPNHSTLQRIAHGLLLRRV